MTTTTHYEQLGELYLEALVNDAYHGGVASTICDAIHEGDPIDAAGMLVRHAMGKLEVTISRISDDQLDLPNETNWPRLDAFWNGPSSAEERAWVISELKMQADRCFDTHHDYADPKGSLHNGGIHWDWVADLKVAGILLLVASSLLKQEGTNG